MSSGIKIHLTDQCFFTYIKFYKLYFNFEESEDENNTFNLNNLRLGNTDLYEVYRNLCEVDGFFDLNVCINIDKIDYFKSIDNEIEKKENKAELKKILEKVKNNKNITISEVNLLSWVWYDIFSLIKFIPLLTRNSKFEKKFKTEIEEYLDNFINNDLTLDKYNFFRFEIQNKKLIELIEKKDIINLYGSKFILKERIDENGFLENCSEFALIQTCFALERMNYLKVNKIWEELENNKNWDLSEYSFNRYIKLSVTLNESFIEELNDSFRKLNPFKYFEKYDHTKKVITIGKKCVNLAIKNKDTDSIKLFETLLKDIEKNWSNDEILDDWGYSLDEETSKNKIYHSAKSLNKKVEKNAEISDFIIFTTKDSRINPKYIKVDK